MEDMPILIPGDLIMAVQPFFFFFFFFFPWLHSPAYALASSIKSG
jgi:hypothetical protein